MTIENQKLWLSPDQVCKLLGISKRTLQNYRDKRIIPFSQIGRKIYFSLSGLEEYMEQHHIKSNCQRGM